MRVQPGTASVGALAVSLAHRAAMTLPNLKPNMLNPKRADKVAGDHHAAQPNLHGYLSQSRGAQSFPDAGLAPTPE